MIEGKGFENGKWKGNRLTSSRFKREKKTISSMISLYCQAFHGSENHLCENCQSLMDYAASRLDRCPFQKQKPTCARCTVHCYRAPLRKQVKEIMRFAGPRMIYTHPILTLYHLLDGLRRQVRKNRTRMNHKHVSSKQVSEAKA